MKDKILSWIGIVLFSSLFGFCCAIGSIFSRPRKGKSIIEHYETILSTESILLEFTFGTGLVLAFFIYHEIKDYFFKEQTEKED